MAKIYKIQDNVDNKVYIGKTKAPLEKRLSEHIKHIKEERYQGTKLSKAIIEHGKENFTIQEITEVPDEIAEEKEEEYIHRYDSVENGLNMSYYRAKTYIRPCQEERIIEMYKNGYNQKEIAQKLGVKEISISRAFRRQNGQYDVQRNNTSMPVKKIDSRTGMVLNAYGFIGDAAKAACNSGKSRYRSMARTMKDIKENANHNILVGPDGNQWEFTEFRKGFRIPWAIDPRLTDPKAPPFLINPDYINPYL